MSLKLQAYHTVRNQRGFTVIELILAIAFISFMLVFVLTSTMQLMAIYTKGLTLKQANQSGRSIAMEIQRTLQAADPALMDTSRVANGRLCTGHYSYVWSNDNNYAPPAPPQILNKFAGDPISDQIGFIRVPDASGAICGLAASADIPVAYRNISTTLISNTLRVRQLRVVQSSTANPGLYRIDITISSDDRSLITYDTTTGGFRCTAADRIGDQYCAVAEFKIYAFARN